MHGNENGYLRRAQMISWHRQTAQVVCNLTVLQHSSFMWQLHRGLVFLVEPRRFRQCLRC